MDLKDIKLEYIREGLNQKDLEARPIEQIKKWMNQAIKSEITYANAASLSTITKDGYPSSRIILIKEILDEGLIFYTDYTGKKALEIIESRKVSLLLFWKELDRQVRIQGTATKIDPEKSEQYFLSRPYESQISALASNQSSVISKEELESRVLALKEQYPEGEVPYPNNWGGYIVSVDACEFWQGRPNRLHDRFEFTQEKKQWKISRLSP
jgi:pyridoxamine 5'-phosphate oxidase